MATDLGDADLRAQFKREVAPLGQFEALNPQVLDADITGALQDAFASAQLAGFFGDHTLYDWGDVEPDLTPREIALVMAYAGVRHLKSHLLYLRSKATYEAGPVRYETEQAASVLKSILDEANKKLNAIEAEMKAEGGVTGVAVVDWYRLRNGARLA